MKLNRFLFGCIIGLLVMCIIFSGLLLKDALRDKNSAEDTLIAVPTTEASADTTEEPTREAVGPDSGVESISVAIYPFLPDLDLAQNILAQMWAEMEPDVELEFVYWDCYVDPSPHGIDVLVYDAATMDYLVKNDLILPVNLESLEDTSDILPFAMDGARYNGALYGLPVMVCSYFLIHYTEDEEMVNVQDFEDLCNLLSERKGWYASDGLQIDYWDGLPYFYLEALMDYTGTYSNFKRTPDVNPPDEILMARLHEIYSIVPEPADYIWAWNYQSRFAQGEGSACYSYSEALSYMTDILDQLTIRPIPFFKGDNVLIYYADVASIGSHVKDPVKKAVCEKLINLMASPEYQAQLCYGSGAVQYLLPAREQVYITAMEQYPMYETLHKLATNENNRIFRFGSDLFDYSELAYEVMG